jgi:hypothetical protein
MIVRFYFALLGLTAVSWAFGQEPTDPSEQLIYEAYSNLQTTSTFQLSLEGSQTIGGQTKYFASTLTWSCGTTAQVVMDDYDTSGRTPQLLRHYVGDGRTLWFYDFVNQRYSGATYGTYGNRGTNPFDDAPRLLGQLYTEANGPSVYLARLMREVNPPTGGTLIPRYKSWAPGYVPGQAPTSPPIQDPIIASQTYSSVGNLIYVLYGPNPILFYPQGPKNSTPPTRSVAFQLYNTMPPDTPANYDLQAIFFAERGPNRLAAWTIQVNDTVLTLNPNIFMSLSPSVTAGWQSVPAPRPAG